jgi:ABC-type cobalamin/Fe3+-siderophores transport system ATPase subunit
VLHLLGDLNESGISIVLTTHDLNGMAAHLPHLVCLNRRVIAAGPPAEVLTAAVLEATFGAGLDVLTHLGMPVVVDSGRDALSIAGVAPEGVVLGAGAPGAAGAGR